MKKVMFALTFVAAMTLAACDGNTNNENDSIMNDTTVVEETDSIVVADSLVETEDNTL